MGFFESAIEKAGHVTHAWSLLVGYERPTYAISLQDARNSCESCHPPTTHRNNSLRDIRRFLPDENNTERHTTMIMRLTGRNFSNENRLGINWHASGNVYFLADGPQALNISYVTATLPDGNERSYRDVRKFPDGPPTVPESDLRRLDCLGCHNRAGHPFPNPEDLVDQALANSTLDSELPYLKKHMMELLQQPVQDATHARVLVEDARARYRAEFPDEVSTMYEREEAYEEVAETAAAIAGVMERSQHLEDENIDWSTFSDHGGHRDGPGCFRCHNGRLQTVDGTPIPVNCTTCHSIPLVTQRNKIPDFYLEMMDKRTPRNHRDPAFMATHMDRINKSCGMCHGDIEYGTDDKSHCSNSGCHDADWKYLDFDALRMTKAETATTTQSP
jgi:hypothetical protein